MSINTGRKKGFAMRSRSFDSLMEAYERLLARPNPADEHFYNGLYIRYRNPVLTREHIPPFWMYVKDSENTFNAKANKAKALW